MRELAGGLRQAVGGHDGGHQAEIARLVRAQLALAHEDLERAVATERTHERAGQAGVGHQPDAVEGGHEAGLLGRDDDVGGERQAHSGPGGDAVDRGDDRLRQVADRLDQRVVLGGQHGPEVALLGSAAQVGAGAEAAAGAGDHDSARRLVARGDLERGQQLFAELAVERVERLGPVEREGRDAVGDLARASVSMQARRARAPIVPRAGTKTPGALGAGRIGLGVRARPRTAASRDHVPQEDDNDRANGGRDEGRDVDPRRPVLVVRQQGRRATANQCADDAGDQAADDAVALVTGDDAARDEAGDRTDDQPCNDVPSILLLQTAHVRRARSCTRESPCRIRTGHRLSV